MTIFSQKEKNNYFFPQMKRIFQNMPNCIVTVEKDTTKAI